MAQDRDNRGFEPEGESPEPQSQGETMRAPGSGKISIPLGGRNARSAAHHADVMQSLVGGTSPKEHVYETPNSKQAKGNRRRLSRKDV